MRLRVASAPAWARPSGNFARSSGSKRSSGERARSARLRSPGRTAIQVGFAVARELPRLHRSHPRPPSTRRWLRSSGRSPRSKASWRPGWPDSRFPLPPEFVPLGDTRGSGTAEPERISRSEDPPGWERIREGSFLEAVLLTQLSGDFPGPVLAMVSVPFHSADRQRVLIPRGARVVGTAQAVQHRDQSRLAVSFHRLLLPDGGWIDLEFAGLNQAGAGGLNDKVNRHYFSTFAAAGAVGALSGLTLAGASPYGLQAGVGQGLGNSATSVLDRFLNRMPEITIRAGHRLRIWFTSDVLVPTPTTPR